MAKCPPESAEKLLTRDLADLATAPGDVHERLVQRFLVAGGVAVHDARQERGATLAAGRPPRGQSRMPMRSRCYGCEMEEDLDALVLPDYTAAVLGVRSWRVRGNVLHSVGKGSAIWQRGWNFAACVVHSHDAPDPQCQCGWHANHDAECFTPWEGPGMVHGIVRGRGTMDVHALGWRCEEAAVVALVRPYVGAGLDVDRVAARYGVPVYESLEAAWAACQHEGQPLPHAARPAHVDDRHEQALADRARTEASSILLALLAVVLALSIVTWALFAAIPDAGVGGPLLASWPSWLWQTQFAPHSAWQGALLAEPTGFTLLRSQWGHLVLDIGFWLARIGWWGCAVGAVLAVRRYVRFWQARRVVDRLHARATALADQR